MKKSTLWAQAKSLQEVVVALIATFEDVEQEKRSLSKKLKIALAAFENEIIQLNDALAVSELIGQPIEESSIQGIVHRLNEAHAQIHSPLSQ